MMIEHSNISIQTEDIEKLKRLRSQLKYKRLKWQVKKFNTKKNRKAL